jgi:hypothetical protein
MRVTDSYQLQQGDLNEEKRKFSAVASCGDCRRGFVGRSRD